MTVRDGTRQAGATLGGYGRFASWAAAVMAAAAAVALAIGVTTPPRSGPFCRGDCITYPFTDAAAFVPRDYLWMYPAALMVLLFVVVVACLHQRATAGSRLFTRVALSLAAISATALLADYFIQLTVVQPSLLKSEFAGLTLLSQYNPHGVFIALEDLGFLVMGLSFLFAAAGLAGRSRLERVARYVFAAGGVLAVVALVVLALIYRSDLEYRYEVAAIVIDWLTLIAGGALLSLLFRREARAWRTHGDRRHRDEGPVSGTEPPQVPAGAGAKPGDLLRRQSGGRQG
jgi:hypothetical protein